MSEVIKVDPDHTNPVPARGLVERALGAGASLETIDRMLALVEHEEARRVASEFVGAMASALGEIDTIRKDAKASSSGREYAYATMAAMAEEVRPIFARHGLTYWFEPVQLPGERNGRLELTCVIAHVAGHEKRTSLTAMIQGAPGTSEAQQVAGTATILQRHTLGLGAGLAVKEDPAVFGNRPAAPDYDVSKVLLKIDAAQTTDALAEVGAAIQAGGAEMFDPIPTGVIGQIRHHYNRRIKDLKAEAAKAEAEREAIDA